MFEPVSAFSGFSFDDQEKTLEFYSRTLGLTVEDNGMGLKIQLPGGGHVFAYPKGKDHTPATFTILNFVVKDINAAVDELVGRGITFDRYDEMPAKQDERGIMRGKAANEGPDIAWFKDPSGNVLSVIED
jgi:hypothetical protein